MNIGRVSRTATMAAAFALFGALIVPATAFATTGNDGEPAGSGITATETTESEAPDATAPASSTEPPAPGTETQDPSTEPPAPGTETQDPSTPPPVPQETQNGSDQIAGITAAPGELEAASRGVIWVSFALSKVALIDGHDFGTVRGQLSGIRTPLSNATENDAYTVTGNWGEAGPNGIEADVAYQITMLGAPTGYWIFPHVEASHPLSSSASASCHVYQGDPGVGGSIASPSPFTCDTSYTQGYPNARVTFTVDLNRSAEAQGVIKTEGPVSLQSGHYEWNVPYHVNGSTVVGENSSTSFDVVLRDGDAPIEPNLAQMTFIYQVVESGVARPFWIAGWSQNYRGNEFASEGKCFVYDQDPLKATVGLKTLKPADVSPYTCTKTSERTIGYRGNYEATFTVAKRQMTDVTLPEQQKALVERVCTQLANCGVSLATVTETFGPGRPASAVINNTQDTPDTLSIATTGSETITNSGGFEIDLTVGTSPANPIGAKYELTLKTHYERSVANTTSTTQTIGMTVPPHQRGWLEGTPPMIHTVGDIVVRDGDRYFNVKNVTVDFPKGKDAAGVDAPWGFTTKSEPLPPTGPAKITLEGTVNTNDGGASSEVSLIGGTYALPLTAGGAVSHFSTRGAEKVTASGSTVWSVTNVVADTDASGGALASGSFAYQIASAGLPTEYWVNGSAITWRTDGAPSSSCVIYRGSPHSGGAPVAEAPYRCVTTINPVGADGIVRATFTISPASVGGTPTTPPTTPPIPPTPPAPDTAANPPATAHTITARLAKSGVTIDGTTSLVGILAIISGVGLMLAVKRRRRFSEASAPERSPSPE